MWLSRAQIGHDARNYPLILTNELCLNRRMMTFIADSQYMQAAQAAAAAACAAAIAAAAAAA